ncbi:DUF3944 domain-containing protein [Cetobacterium sp.]|uniref:DUF3944 domain-containing protein n=1 Tax=Cetobacterium sp. TaxID=2071632 RepID=UPI003F31D302
MAYLKDQDLEILKECEDEELRGLVECLIYDKDGERRYTEELSKSKEFHLYGDKYSMYWKRIAEELQKFGGDTIVNAFRLGSGIKYLEILRDVAKELKVDYKTIDRAEEIENKILLKSFQKIWKDFSKEKKVGFVKEFNIKGEEILGKDIEEIAKEYLLLNKDESYKITALIVNNTVFSVLGRGINVGNIFKFNSFNSFTNNSILGLYWLNFIKEISSPARRVTVPAIFYIALIRKQIRFRLNIKECKPIKFSISNGEVIDNNLKVYEQYELLNLNGRANELEINKKYNEIYESYIKMKEKNPELEELYNYKCHDLKKAYEIIEEYRKNVSKIFEAEKLIVECPSCRRKIKIENREGKYRCKNCTKIVKLSKEVVEKNYLG